jgi:signal transduction histidine kinase/CheY-like chemotaxis protein
VIEPHVDVEYAAHAVRFAPPPDLIGLLDALPAYAALIDARHRIVMANAAMHEVAHAGPGGLVDRYCPQALHNCDGPIPGCPLEDVLLSGDPEEREIHDHERGLWFKSCVYPTAYRTAEGVPIYLHTVRDITREKTADLALRAHVRSQETQNELLRVSVADLPLEQRLQTVLRLIVSLPWLEIESKGAVFLMDRDNNTLVLKAEHNLPHPLTQACARVALGHCICGRAAQSGEVLFVDRIDDRHDQRFDDMRPHGHYAVPLRSGDQVLGVLCLYLAENHRRVPEEESFLRAAADYLAGIVERERATEERDRLAAAFVQSQKMETVGRLAGGVAHDFNNLLTAVLGYTEMLLGADDLPPKFQEALVEVRTAAERGAGLTQRLLAFSRRQVIAPEVLDLNAVLNGVRGMVARLIGENVEFKTVCGTERARVKADRGQIEQILVNLIVNARDAMPDGGTITAETSTVTVDDESARFCLDTPRGVYVALSVSDTGCGMDAESRRRIFEPFFTTKPVGQGTGLGLSMVYGAVKQNDGQITVYSEPGLGTTIRIYLPAVEAAPAVVAPRAGADPGGTETVLLVEDDDALRRFTGSALGRLGYRVLSASRGEEALAVIREHGGGIDLVLSDVVMPGMTGKALREELAAAGTRVKVLLMSGYVGDGLTRRGVVDLGTHFLPKPFAVGDLARKVRAVLDS